MPSRNPSTSQLTVFVHSIMPSFTSLLGSLCASIFITLVHVAILGLHSSFLHSQSNDDALLTNSFAKLVQITQVFAHNNLLNSLLTVVFWGLIGFVVYALATQLLDALMGWYDAEHEILMSRPGYAISHPRLGSFFIRQAWRFMVGLLFIVSTLLLLPVFRRIVASDHRLIESQSLVSVIRAAGLSILLWILIMHLYTVLARWYTFRTRVFSEIT